MYSSVWSCGYVQYCTETPTLYSNAGAWQLGMNGGYLQKVLLKLSHALGFLHLSTTRAK
jgi:hypothetical protein